MVKSKIDRLRGKRSHGTGNTKNKRGAGCKGGRGRGGSQKHKFTKYYTTFGNKIKLKPKKQLITITLRDLDLINTKDNIIDANNYKFDKVLGTGQITKKIILKNAKVTDVAKQKIEDFGGKIE